MSAVNDLMINQSLSGGSALAQIGQLRKIQDEYFVRMMLPHAEQNAEPYTKEERQLLELILENDERSVEKNFVVIGAGTLWHLDLAYSRVRTYVAIESLSHLFIHRQVEYLLSKQPNIRLVGSEFGYFAKSMLPTGNSIFVFHFNVISYLDNPVAKINRYIEPGDVVFISTWNGSPASLRVRKEYFDYLNSYTTRAEEPDLETSCGITDLDLFPCSAIANYQGHERHRGQVIDALVIYTKERV